MNAQLRFQTSSFLPQSSATVKTGLLQRKCACGTHTVAGDKCDECKNKQGVLQRKSSDNSQHSEVPPIVHEVLNSSGQPLDKSTRAFFETPFAHNFSGVPVSSASKQLSQNSLTIGEPADVYEQEANRVADSIMLKDEHEKTLSTNKQQDEKFDLSYVRVHTGERAAESARAVNALAYTVGNNIVFGAGQFAARTREGRRLLAHELTHVIQQSSGETPALQRDEPKQNTASSSRVDVALVLDDDPTSMIEARSYAATVIRATSSADAKAKLLALGKPIGKLFVVSHSNRLGEVQIISGIGTISWVKLSDFSKDLKGLPSDKAPQEVDFRGCKLGEAPSEMETFRQNVGAQSARATNCWSMGATSEPLTMPDGTPIKQESQIKDMEKQFNRVLRQKINGLKAENGTSVKDCIVGLAVGETADRNFEKIKKLYFRNEGNLLAGWASPEFNHTWQKGSICVKDMTATTSPCKIVTQTAPASGGGAKTGAMLLEPVESSPVDLLSESETEADA
jgi:hypothetical protein